MKWDNLPEGWKVKALGRVAQIKAGDPAPQGKNYFENGAIPFVRMQDLGRYGQTTSLIRTADRINQHALEECKLTVFPRGSILVPKSGSVYLNHRAILAVDACVVSHIAIVQAKPIAFTPFLYYFLCLTDLSQWASKTTGLDSLNLTNLSRVLIPLPPLEEQHRIAEILELADELRHKRKAANQLIDKIIRSLFLDMFGDPATNPKGWEVRELKDVAAIDAESVNPGKLFASEEFTYIDISSVDGATGRIVSPQKLLATKAPSRARRLIHKGDVIVSTVRPNLKAFALVDEQFDGQICSTGFAVLTPREGILESRYLFHYVRTEHFVAQLVKAMKGAMYPAVNQADVEATTIHVPLLPLQQRFAQLVSHLEEKQQQMEQAAEELEKLYQSLLKKAFTGELTKQWREINQIRWQLPQFTERQKVLLAVLYSYNTIRKTSPPITMLMKYMFLLQQEKGLELEYAFVPYKFGPFSKEVYEDIEALERETLVLSPKKSKNIERQETALDEDATDDIEATLAVMPESKKVAVDELIKEYGSMGFRELMDYVYDKYPEFTVESRRVVKQGRRSQKTSKMDN